LTNRDTEALTSDLAARAFVRECRLSLLEGDSVRETHLFAAERIVIGADSKADFVLDDPATSKFHCEIRFEGNTCFVKDLGSRNGTTVDRVPILDAPLRDGALLGCGRVQLRFELGSHQREVTLSQRDRFGRLRGASVAMRGVYALLETAANATTTVLVQGESGAGKDLAAESLHIESPRRDAPFVVVDCGAIPPALLESELFGHEAGSFTGATTTRAGAFELANGGTIVLDEIGELALDLQPKLLRVLDKHEIQRVGSSQRIAVDVRVIAATNRDLKAEVNAKRFRSDLYFRLAVLVVRMPPLRERMTDLPMLVDAILDELGDRETEMARAFASGAMLSELLRHAWPGNVRELRNYIEACIVRQTTHTSRETTSDPTIDVSRPLRDVRDAWIKHVERRYLEQLLLVHGGNVSAAARAAGIDRVHLHRLLVRVGLR
jgi:two-component system response regulator GlrR